MTHSLSQPPGIAYLEDYVLEINSGEQGLNPLQIPLPRNLDGMPGAVKEALDALDPGSYDYFVKTDAQVTVKKHTRVAYEGLCLPLSKPHFSPVSHRVCISAGLKPITAVIDRLYEKCAAPEAPTKQAAADIDRQTLAKLIVARANGASQVIIRENRPPRAACKNDIVFDQNKNMIWPRNTDNAVPSTKPNTANKSGGAKPSPS